MWQRTWSHQTLDLLLHTGVLAIGHLYLNTTYAANNFYCTTCVKTHNLLQVVNRHEQCCSEQAWTVLCCTLWTLLSTVLFRSVRTALFRADEPTGVNNAVLSVHIKHDNNPVLCCVNRFEKGLFTHNSRHVTSTVGPTVLQQVVLYSK